MRVERTLRRKWLKLLWTPLAFVPLLILLAPLTTRFLIAVVCLMYLGPTVILAWLLQVELFTLAHRALVVGYCALLGLLFGAIFASYFALPKRVPLARARGVLIKTWLPVLCVLAILGFDYKGFVSFGGSCPGRIDVLNGFCQDVTWFHSRDLGGYIDTEHVARFDAQPDVFNQIIRANELVEVALEDVPNDFWRQPPWWWNVQRGEDISIYKSVDFPFEDRGPDGDHYLLFRDAGKYRVYVLLDANF